MKLNLRRKVFVTGGLLLSMFLSYSQSGDPTGAPGIKTFALDPNLAGAASNSVNLFTGDVALPVNIVSLPGHEGLDVSVSVSYNSGIEGLADKWNLESPTSILGLGWNMNIPRIVCNNQKTGAREDDEYYLLENGVASPLVRTVSGNDVTGSYYQYESTNFQFWIIRYYYDPVEMGGSGVGSNKWVITKEDGSKYVYGDKNSNRSTIQWAIRWGNYMGNSAQITGQSRMANAWNLSEILNKWGEKILFEYENIDQFVGTTSGQKHTEASYIKSITDTWGRKVNFVYREKQPPFYMEPHTERAEPDAYQEYYEKKYLDHIDVIDEAGAKNLAVHFGYDIINGGTNSCKLLLTSITQRNENGNSLPAMKFSYFQSGATKGLLRSINYPSGGTVEYTYTEKTITHSNREIAVNAPAGYGEPKTWFGDDYVVVAWRQLGANASHDSGPREVRVFVYQWVGEWKETYCGPFYSVNLEGDQYNLDYKDFRVAIEKNFFALFVRTASANKTHHLSIYSRSQINRGDWVKYSTTRDYGENKPALLSGNNFVAACSDYDEAGTPSVFYTYAGNTWREDVIDQTEGYHNYTATNNFLISHNRKIVLISNPEINFYYLSEDKKWVNKSMPSVLVFKSTDPSYWHSSNNMAIAMADDNPEFAYRWDINYNNFYRDSKDKNNADLFGEQTDAASVFMMDNGMVGVKGRIVRFDGLQWISDNITSTNNSPFGLYFSYGDDFVVRPTTYITTTMNYRGGRKVFNPNTLSWEADVIMDGNDRGLDFANAGIDYYYFGNGFYYRQTDGTWVKKFTYPSGTGMMWSHGGWPRYQVFYGPDPHPVVEARSFKNGEMQNPYFFPNRKLLYIPYKFKSIGVGGESVVTYPSYFPTGQDATTIYINRLVNEEFTGLQKDYPVTLITVKDGITERYVSLDYNAATASMDASGHVAQYNEVTEVQGSATVNVRPVGYTKTYFYNGLTGQELGNASLIVDIQWTGLSYSKELYDADGNLIEYEKPGYETFSRQLLNDVAKQVHTGYYVRPTSTTSKVDNVISNTVHVYDQTTGFIKKTYLGNFDSKNNTAIIEYKYFWEQYDPQRALNILSPVIQEKKSLGDGLTQNVTTVNVVTWKKWNDVFAPHKNYSWKRTGVADFDFTGWSNAAEPPSGWLKNSEINSLSNVGDILQMTNY